MKRTLSVLLLLSLGVGTELWASGWPPFAREDSITVFRGGVADRLDSGDDSVLDNDVDLEGDTLTAILVRDVRNGTLTLNDDGTFLYEHEGDDDDSDSFRYRAYDGTGRSRRTTVTIRIEEVPNTPPLTVGNVPDQEAIEGIPFFLDLGGNFADLDEGDVLRFGVSGLPISGSLDIDPSTGVLSGTPVAGDARTKPYDVRVTATDKAGASASIRFQLTIFEDTRSDVGLSLRIAENPIVFGSPAAWTLDIRNSGPGDLEEGRLDATWSTSGPALTLTAPSFCQVSGNDTATPGLTCSVGFLGVSETLSIEVEGLQNDDGEHSVIGVLTADDPFLGNNSAAASAQIIEEFSEGPAQLVELSSVDVDAGDLNGDGAIDIVTTGADTMVFFNNGARAVTTPGTSIGSGGTAVQLLDWNGDGSLDIAVGGLAGRAAEIFLNDTTGTFSSVEQFAGNDVGRINDLSAADLDGDGRFELILAGSIASGFLKGQEQGGAESQLLESGAGYAVDVADVDQDGDADVILVRAADRAVDVHYNNGDASSFVLTRLYEGSVATAGAYDLNGDSRPDLVLGLDSDDLNPPKHKLLVQQGGGDFAHAGSFGAAPVSALLTGDIDLDGSPDVVAINAGGVHQTYLGNGAGSLALAPEQIVSNGMKRGLLTDFNGDESLDLIMVGADADVLEIHANNGIGRMGLGDRISPDLQLLGESRMQLAAGEEFVDPGATAVDDIDGDITDRIEVVGEINTAVIGTQSLVYRVADRAGNEVSVSRTVTIGSNTGAGGSGGGASSPWLLFMLILLLAGRHRLTAMHAWKRTVQRFFVRSRF